MIINGEVDSKILQEESTNNQIKMMMENIERIEKIFPNPFKELMKSLEKKNKKRRAKRYFKSFPYSCHFIVMDS